ncbi:MAG TPA: HAMP domain-containing sensor histidine kinase [Anaeromyxobacteraceae bacterium]|nr:HAMP domain-containing sensor histidine kinase [Anaeromyxobacteraceae bacterium]
MRRLRHLVLGLTVFAALAVSATGALLLERFRSSFLTAIADRQAFALQERSHLLGEEIASAEVELTALASEAGVDLADDDIDAEKRAVARAATGLAAYPSSAAILDLSGAVVWSEPEGLTLDGRGAALVRQAITAKRATVSTHLEEIDVTVPVRDRGALATIIRVSGARLLGARQPAVLRESGHVSLFRRAGNVREEIAASGPRPGPALVLEREGQQWMQDDAGRRWLVTEDDIAGPEHIAFLMVQSASELERDFAAEFRSLVAVVVTTLGLAIVAGVLLAVAIGRLEDARFETLKARELAAMAKSSMAISHEVKNSLNGLSLAIDLLASRRADAVASDMVHRQARHEVARLQGVAEDLTLLSAAPHLRRSDVDLSSLCRRVVTQLADLAAECDARMDLMLAPEPLPVRVDPAKLLAAIQAIARNGLEAMGPGAYGQALGSTPKRRERRLTLTSRLEDTTAILEIADTGCGLSDDIRQQLFEPFTTTKRDGTGLGLTIAQRVVHAHGGSISAEDRAGGGTVFRIRLPTISGPSLARSPLEGGAEGQPALDESDT